MLCGEYVVLDGTAAGSMAVNRRAFVTLSPHARDCSVVRSPGYLGGEFRFRSSSDGSIAWIDQPPSPDAFRLLETAWRNRSGAGDVLLTLDTRAFHDTTSGRKLGLGSSAALATALIAALAWPTAEDGAAVLPLAGNAHREFQRGSGSGIDVATSVHGGVIAYRRGQDVHRLEWPDELAYRIYWSGVSADTVTRVTAYRHGARADADGRLRAATGAVLAAFRNGATDPLLGAFAAYTEALSAFDRANNLGIFGAGHDRLAEAARGMAGCVYKPCGAGGGDIGVAFAARERVLDDFTTVAQQHGFAPLDAALDLDGVRVRTS